jgi:TfoX/Sxy family transcriptional regulator of competence genes
VAYDEALATRTRKALAAHRDAAGAAVEKKMFGGLAFLVRGHMCCGILADRLVVRLGAGQETGALAELHVRPMDFTGRPMKGFLYVEPEGTRAAQDLSRWIDRAVRHARSLPPRTGSGRAAARPARRQRSARRG